MKKAQVSPLDTVTVRQRVTVTLQGIHFIPQIVPGTELGVHTSASGSASHACMVDTDYCSHLMADEAHVQHGTLSRVVQRLVAQKTRLLNTKVLFLNDAA